MKGKKFFYWLGQSDFKIGYPFPSYSDWKYPEWTLYAYREGFMRAYWNRNSDCNNLKRFL